MRMFHLGGNIMCPCESIVGVFDLDTATVSRHTRDFLRRAQEAGAVIAVGEDLPQSFVVTSVLADESHEKHVYLAPQSSANLAKKLEIKMSGLRPPL